MGFGSGLDIFVHRRTPLSDANDGIVAKYRARGSDKEHTIHASHLLGFHSAFAQFREIAGLPSWISVGLGIVNIEAARSPNAFHRQKRQAEQITFPVLERWECRAACEKLKTPDRISAWSARISVSSGLQWGGVLNPPLQ